MSMNPVIKLINSLRTPDKKSEDEFGSEKQPHLDKKAQQNTINELQILIGHEDIARLLLKVDETRVVSGADDGNMIVWNHSTGERLLTLTGHTKPVTCFMLINQNTLASGSSDKTIKLWNLDTGECIKTLTSHTGSIRCFCMFPGGDWCSGANDRQLVVWNQQGDQLRVITRQDDENLQCLVSISEKFLVTGSNSSLLYVYDVMGAGHQMLAYHRESVQSIVRLSEHLFASGSLDGTIVVWQTETLQPYNILFYPEKYKNENKVFIYSINYLLPMGDNYLAAAIGRGIQVFDIFTGDVLVECKNAHESDVTCLISLYDSTRLITGSSDSSVRIWEVPPQQRDLLGHPGFINLPTKRSRKKRRNPPHSATHVGEMWGHTEAIHAMIPLNDNSFVSCGGDHTVILWKDGQVQTEIRNGYATVSLRQHQAMEEYYQSLRDERMAELELGESFEDLRPPALSRPKSFKSLNGFGEQPIFPLEMEPSTTAPAVESTGHGIVVPTVQVLTLEELNKNPEVAATPEPNYSLNRSSVVPELTPNE